jgi:hypothetical protein
MSPKYWKFRKYWKLVKLRDKLMNLSKTRLPGLPGLPYNIRTCYNPEVVSKFSILVHLQLVHNYQNNLITSLFIKIIIIN